MASALTAVDSEETVGFFARLGLAFGLFFKVLFDSATAARAAVTLSNNESPTLPSEPTPKPTKPTPGPAQETAALQLLAALQREGRFIDFVKEDVQSLTDDEVGGAARLVHEGCKKVVSTWFQIEPVWPGEDGTSVTLEEGFDARRIQLTGNVSGQPPFTGSLVHHGWSVSNTTLPKLNAGSDTSVLAPAEVEL